jgi:hypothetical protein
MGEPIRVSAQEARQKAVSHSAELVCAYEDELKCKKLHLEGAISLKEFRAQLHSISKDQAIIFYCA